MITLILKMKSLAIKIVRPNEIDGNTVFSDHSDQC